MQRRGGMEVWRIVVGVGLGGLEARCKCSDVEVWGSGGPL